MIRVPDLKNERVKITKPREPIESEFQYDVNHMPSSKGPLQSNKPTLTEGAPAQNVQFLESRRVNTLINNTDGPNNNQLTYEFETKPLPEFSRSDARHNWSYYFPLSNVDDFQITIPNANTQAVTTLEEKSGWQTDESKLFVRVNISPGPDNEATLFVSFTKPCNLFVLPFLTLIQTSLSTFSITSQKIG